MKISFLTIIALMSINISFSQISAKETGEKFITSLFSKNFASAIEYIDESIYYKINEDILQKTVNNIEGKLGTFRKIISLREDTASFNKPIYYYINFENTKIDIKVNFSDNKKILGFFIHPHEEHKVKNQ